MDISELKTGGKKKSPEETSAASEGKNIDGDNLRDFGNGLKEFDPLANGFTQEEEEKKKDDATAALEELDSQMKARREEVEKYNELLDQYGGEITEEELREELGQGKITKILQDGVGGKFEDQPGERADASAILSDNDSREDTFHTSSVQTDVNNHASQELDELEKELLEEDDDMSETINPIEEEKVVDQKIPVQE